MDEILEEEKKPSQPKHTALFVTSTIAIFIVALFLRFVWSINFKEIVDSADQGGELNGLAIFLATIFLALPFLVASALTVIIGCVFTPLTLVKLRESSSKAMARQVIPPPRPPYSWAIHQPNIPDWRYSSNICVENCSLASISARKDLIFR